MMYEIRRRDGMTRSRMGENLIYFLLVLSLHLMGCRFGAASVWLGATCLAIGMIVL